MANSHRTKQDGSLFAGQYQSWRELEESLEWRSLRSEEDRLEADLQHIRRQKRALVLSLADQLPAAP